MTTSMERTIGAVEQSVKNLENIANRMDFRMDDIRNDISSLSAKVAGLDEKITILAPTVKRFEEAALQSAGAKKLGKYIWGVIISLGTIGAAYWTHGTEIGKALVPPH